jgi:ketosteroid isomerase-like protein
MENFADKLAIIELMHNYILSIDSHDNDQFANNFTEDGVYDSPWGVAEGKTAITGNIAYWHSSGITAGKRHYIGAVRILELDGDTAKVESNYWIAEAATTPGIVATGHYTDTVRKESGAWKIAHRKQVVDPSFKFN